MWRQYIMPLNLTYNSKAVDIVRRVAGCDYARINDLLILLLGKRSFVPGLFAHNINPF